MAEDKPESMKKPSKLEAVVLGVVLAGLGIGLAYGAFKGGEYLAGKLSRFNDPYRAIPSDNGHWGIR